MTDEKPKRRAWLQLHLSTCVVLMVVAGVLIWSNLVGHNVTYIIQTKPKATGYNRRVSYFVYGWPLIVWGTLEDVELFYEKEWHHDETEFERYSIGEKEGFLIPKESMAKNAFINTIVAFAIWILVALGCESLFRRRERKRAAQDSAP